ncbi:ABC transporter permease [Lachnospiraceae bacterium MD329]|nr:ABC transporter permease [Lachnospiraceae bacterium MD329]
MILKILRADKMKLRRSPVWIAFLLVPLVPAFLGTANYLNNLELLTSEWYSLWTQHTLFTGYIFLPVILGIYCSYLMRLEHNNRNWNNVLTMPANPALFFLSKVIIASIMLVFTGIWISVLFVISGKIAGITAPVPYGQLSLWISGGILGGMVMISIQLLLSMLIKSFAIPIGISLAGGFSGLVVLSKGFGHIYPYALMAFGMKSNNNMQQISQGDYGQFVIVCIIYILLFTIIGGTIIKKKEL